MLYPAGRAISGSSQRLISQSLEHGLRQSCPACRGSSRTDHAQDSPSLHQLPSMQGDKAGFVSPTPGEAQTPLRTILSHFSPPSHTENLTLLCGLKDIQASAQAVRTLDHWCRTGQVCQPPRCAVIGSCSFPFTSRSPCSSLSSLLIPAFPSFLSR